MRRSLAVRLLLAAAVALTFAGCKKQVKVVKPQYDRQLPPGQYALRKIIDPAMIPDITFACYETLDLRRSIDNSLRYLNKSSSKKYFPCGDITHERSVASLQTLAKLLDQGLAGRPLAAAIKEQFEFYQSVGCDDMGTVLFTGYYTPIFNGSMTPTAVYRYPLYKQPQDLVKGEDGTILGRKMPDGTFTQYPARRELEQSGQLKGTELIYLSDPFEVYIAHVQGSAKIRMADGSLVTVGYTANNGHEYKSIGQELIADGVLPKDGLSLQRMIDYFKANPNMVDHYIYRNPRFVFFQMDSGDPRGSLNEPVTPMRTIATDKSIYPRGGIAVIKTNLPRPVGMEISKRPYTGFALDQDTGGAIRAPGRCDVYMGSGDEAGKMAGQVYEEGKLYYIFVKPELMAPQAVSGVVEPQPQSQNSAY
ncbi:MAG TPA: MltA domain-containing protein [Dehalococcoidales bacterium]|nr:MltA domain-containing protein [Dehalococcoidales bacterium]